MISTNGAVIRLIDAFRGHVQQTLSGHRNTEHVPLEAAFSPDSQLVVSGATDGRVHMWDAKTGSEVCVSDGGHKAAVKCVRFNPKYMMMATACDDIAFWLPTSTTSPDL